MENSTDRGAKCRRFYPFGGLFSGFCGWGDFGGGGRSSGPTSSGSYRHCGTSFSYFVSFSVFGTLSSLLLQRLVGFYIIHLLRGVSQSLLGDQFRLRAFSSAGEDLVGRGLRSKAQEGRGRLPVELPHFLRRIDGVRGASEPGRTRRFARGARAWSLEHRLCAPKKWRTSGKTSSAHDWGRTVHKEYGLTRDSL